MTGKTDVNAHFLAGVTLCGYRKLDGTIEAFNGDKINGWPDTVTVGGVTFTFETEEYVGSDSDPRGRFFNAVYV
jgi:hypothetical protein